MKGANDVAHGQVGDAITLTCLTIEDEAIDGEFTAYIREYDIVGKATDATGGHVEATKRAADRALAAIQNNELPSLAKPPRSVEERFLWAQPEVHQQLNFYTEHKGAFMRPVVWCLPGKNSGHHLRRTKPPLLEKEP